MEQKTTTIRQIKWVTAETASLRSVSTHAYIETEDGGNKALCGNSYITETGDESKPFSELESDQSNTMKFYCKRCLKTFNQKYKPC